MYLEKNKAVAYVVWLVIPIFSDSALYVVEDKLWPILLDTNITIPYGVP